MANSTIDVLRTLPPRPLGPGERQLLATWLAVAGDVALAYVSERRSDDPAIYRRIVIAMEADCVPTYLIHTPTNMDIWVLMHVSPEFEGRSFDSLRDALNFIRPVLSK